MNLLVKVEGTPLDKQEDLEPIELVRTIATACIIMPKSRIRLSAGRTQMSDELQTLLLSLQVLALFSQEKSC